MYFLILCFLYSFQLENGIKQLQKKSEDLESAALKGDTGKDDDDSKEPKHQSRPQIIYAENRVYSLFNHIHITKI